MPEISLEEKFKSLAFAYSKDRVICERAWNEIRDSYCQEKRHYHNLKHIESVLLDLEEVNHLIRDWHACIFAVFYHDLIYDTGRDDNEKKSAEYARICLKKFGVPEKTILQCQALINATATHASSADQDVNFFLDADLSILGKAWERYFEYVESVRQEYKHVPDAIFRNERKKILTRFISSSTIFKTSYFFEKYEVRARFNIAKELELL